MRPPPFVTVIALAWAGASAEGCLLTLDPSFPAPDASVATDLGRTDIAATPDRGAVSDTGTDLGTDTTTVATDAGADVTTDLGTGAGMDALTDASTDAACAPDVAVRLLAPMSGSAVSRSAPTLSWAAPAGATSVQVHITSTRPSGSDGGVDAGSYVTDAISDAMDIGRLGSPATELLTGHTYFWQVRAVAPCVGPWSPAWQFYVPPMPLAPRMPDGGARADTSWGTIPDVNGDGYADLAAGVPVGSGATASARGRVEVYFGGPSGITIGTGPSVVLYPPVGDPGATTFGTTVTGAGDVNGDGVPDLLVGTRVGRAFVFLGAVSGFGSAPPLPIAITAATTVTIAGVGDTNADGYGDVVIADGNVGRVSFFPGGPMGPSLPGTQISMTVATVGAFGLSLAGVGDFNRDGYADTLIGAPYADRDAGTASGQVFVSLGSPTGSLAPRPLALPGGASAGALFGSAVAGIGDVDGDGWEDVAIGDPTPGYPQVVVVHGLSTAVVTVLTPTSSAAGVGFGVGLVGAGDVNGDGYGDLLVSSSGSRAALAVLGGPSLAPGSISFVPLAPPPLVGSGTPSLAGAGDFNGDGIDDIALGWPRPGSTEPGTVDLLASGGPILPVWAAPPIVTLMETGISPPPSSTFGSALAAGR